jgi:tetratricopeptide (TPR) repeat protein
MKREIVFSIAFTALLAGCAINERTAHRYANAAEASSQSGNWAASRENWKRALINAKLAHMDDHALAVANYEYGRASGVLCDWTEAEFGLKEAYRLDSQSGGTVFKDTYELGRMNFDRKQFAAAIEYFSQVKTAFDAVQAETRDPLGYADFLDEYAASLEQTGKGDAAKPLRARSTELRKTFPNRDSHTEKTPYGTQCNS